MRDYETPSVKLSLVLAAGELFAEHGFDGVTIRDIVKKARVNLGNMTYHFSSKEEFYREVIRYAIDKGQTQNWIVLAEQALSSDKSQLELAKVIDTCIKTQLAGILGRHGLPWRHKLILRELLQPTSAWKMLVKQTILPELGYMTRLYTKAVPTAKVLDAKVWALTMHSHAAFYILSMHNIQDLIGVDPLSEAFVDTIINHVARLMVISAGLPYPPIAAPTRES